MSDEKDMATKESLFSLIERIESTLEDKISELKEFIDRVFEVSNEDGKRIEELKEQVEDNRLAIDIVKNLTIPHENREVLRELKPLLKTIDYNNNLWNQIIFNKKLDSIFKKLSGKSKPEQLNEIHREYEKGLKEGKWLEYPPRESAEDMAKIEQIIQIYDNGHENVFYPDKYVLVAKEDLEWLFSIVDQSILRDTLERNKKLKRKYLEEEDK